MSPAPRCECARCGLPVDRFRGRWRHCPGPGRRAGAHPVQPVARGSLQAAAEQELRRQRDRRRAASGQEAGPLPT